MKVIIIDDEESARMTLRSILEGFFKDVVVVAEAETPAIAVRMIDEHHPDVIFLDIQMGSESGFDVLESISHTNFQIIIVSAHKQHAYDSFRFKAADYLLKPVRISDLRIALDKVRENLKATVEDTEQALLRPISQDQFRLQLIIPEMLGFSIVKLSDIIRVEGAGNYTNFYVLGGRCVTASKTMREFEDLLIPHGFVRIHKSHIINVYQLISYVRGRGGDVIMSDGVTIPVSRDRRDPLLEMFIK